MVFVSLVLFVSCYRTINSIQTQLKGMNYAEDRLDRRARHADADNTTSSSSNPLEQDLTQAHLYLQEDNNIHTKAKGHELAGRTLRDAGLSPQATFHYGMAWIISMNHHQGIDHVKEIDYESGGASGKAVGDYAQMVDLAGFSEVGVLSLLYYSLGGTFTTFTLEDQRNGQEGAAHYGLKDDHAHENIFRVENQHRYTTNCGCGMKQCGASPCFIPDQMLSSQLYQDIMKSFQSLEVYLQNPSRETCLAENLLDSVEKATKKKDPIKIQPPSPSHIPLQLQFWQADENNNNQLSPLLQILLLKILYSSPIGSCFLYLAVESIRHLALSLPISSLLGRSMAQSHKSHWAYYILIYNVVLGERVKKHRRGKEVPYHFPIWDIVHSLDQRTFGFGDEIESSLRGNDGSLVGYLENLVEYLSHDSSARGPVVPAIVPTCLPHDALSHKYIFAIGDSHVLSIGWQTLHVNNNHHEIYRTIVPCPITGLKAWHTRDETKFFTKYNLEYCLQRLPSTCQTILLSAGEIDCREGIGGTLLEGFANDVDDAVRDAVRNTVKEYVAAVRSLADRFELQVLLLPVAPHAYRSAKKGRATGRGLRRERMLLWNDTLRELCSIENQSDAKQRVFLLDYETGLRSKNEDSPVGFVLNKHYNADFTHMNSAFLPLLEKSVVESDCDLNLL